MAVPLRDAIDQLRPEFVEADARIAALGAANTYFRAVPRELVQLYIIQAVQLRRTYGPDPFADAQAAHADVLARYGTEDGNDLRLSALLADYPCTSAEALDNIEMAHVKLVNGNLDVVYGGYYAPSCEKFMVGGRKIDLEELLGPEHLQMILCGSLPCGLIICDILVGGRWILHLLDIVTRERVLLDPFSIDGFVPYDNGGMRFTENNTYVLVDDFGRAINCSEHRAYYCLSQHTMQYLMFQAE